MGGTSELGHFHPVKNTLYNSFRSLQCLFEKGTEGSVRHPSPIQPGQAPFCPGRTWTKRRVICKFNRYCKYSIYRKDWQGQKRDNCRTREMGVKKQLDEGHPPPTVDEGHPHPGGGRIKRASYAKQPCCCCCCCSQRRQWLSHGVLPSTCSVVCTLVS